MRATEGMRECRSGELAETAVVLLLLILLLLVSLLLFLLMSTFRGLELKLERASEGLTDRASSSSQGASVPV